MVGENVRNDVEGASVSSPGYSGLSLIGKTFGLGFT